VTGYVWEELLSQLTPDRRHALAVLVAVGGADDEIAAALLGPDTRLDVLLDGLPLVVRARTGWWSLHGLWAAALHHHLDAGQVAQVRRVAAAVLRRRRHYHDAMELLLAAAAWDDVRDLVVDVCEVFTSLLPADVLQGWLHRLPPEVQRTPEGLLLAAMVVEPTNPGAAEQLLEQALAAAPATAAVRHACLNALVLLAFWRADRAQMKLLVQRLEELARIGHVQAAGVTALLRALLAADAARVRGELAVPGLASGAPLSPWQDWLHAHIVLLPEARPRWDQSPPPGCFGELLTVAQALVALREPGSLSALGRLPVSARRHLRALLPAPWASELAVAMVTAGQEEGRALLEDLGASARSTLRAQSRSAVAPVAATAHRLLREIPAVPSYRLDLRVLGPLELRRDGVPVAAPELRRERVRQLLAYLVGHDRPTRAAVTADLWPDLDETAAGRNLPVTLTHLQSVLEPGRSDPDPPCFLRSSGPVLHLVVDGPLVVDAREFERYLDEAAVLERQGVPSAALDAYQRALDLWRGDYLADVPHGDWLELERDRFGERFVATAVRAGQLLHARGQVAEARVLAERALRTDPWSEGACQLRIAAQLAAGDLVGAHRSMDRCRQMLRELGVPPQQQTIALARRLQAARQTRSGAHTSR
jgi:DNA-binding SARP family transcriptional activator